MRIWDPDQLSSCNAEPFIEVAEETGLLAVIDEWVLRQVIDQAATWRSGSPGPPLGGVAINVTARHLADAGFAPSLLDELAAHGLAADALQVEVTERVLMEASNSAMSALTILRDAGVKVGLDDFGTGYSSLSYLRMFPLDFVKIDRSFIAELTRGGAEAAIAASIVDLAHALGMTVVAEGVETPSQAEQLVAFGCDRAQGFHFAPAGSPEEIERRFLGVDSVSDDAPDARAAAKAARPQGAAITRSEMLTSRQQ